MSNAGMSEYNEEEWVAMPKPSLFEMLLPMAALPLMALLIVVLPLCMLTAKSLFLPFFEWLQSVIMPVNVGVQYTHLSLMLLIKMVLYGLFTFTGVMLLVLKIACIYHETWSRVFEQPNQYHPAYHPHPRDSLVALFNWNLYRLYRMIGPPVGYAILLTLIIVIGYWFFDLMEGFWPMFFQFSLGFFVCGILGLMMLYTFFNGLRRGITTLMADVIAITEPELPTQAMYERAQQLAFQSPWSVLLMLGYLLFLGFVLYNLVVFLSTYSVQDMLQFSSKSFSVLFTTLLMVLLFTALNFLKFVTYHDSMNRYYRRHPQLCR